MSGDDLHSAPLISHKRLLQILEGANAMSLTRWRDKLGMPGAVKHGYYDLEAILGWVWAQKVKAEEEQQASGSDRDERALKLQDIRIEREMLELSELKRETVNRKEYEEAETTRINLAVSLLYSIPDRLINVGLLADADRGRMLDELGAVVDKIQSRISEMEVDP